MKKTCKTCISHSPNGLNCYAGHGVDCKDNYAYWQKRPSNAWKYFYYFIVPVIAGIFAAIATRFGLPGYLCFVVGFDMGTFALLFYIANDLKTTK